MRVVVYGAGAIGGVIGGRLAQAGQDVVLIARGAHAAAMAHAGLLLESPTAAERVAVPVVTDPAEIAFRPGDVVLISVKSQDTASVLDRLQALVPRTISIVCAQNGVGNERAALRLFPNVVAMNVMCPATHLVPGEVQVFTSPCSGILDLGRYPAGSDDTCDELSAALRAATFVSETRADIMRWKYSKLIVNLGNAVEALCGPAAPGVSELQRLARDEGRSCLAAAGIDVATEQEDSDRRGDHLRIRPVGGERRGGGSTWQSLERGGGSIETDHLNGEIVLLGRLHGVPTPVNEMLQQAMYAAASDRRPPGELAPEALLARLPIPS